MDVFAILKILTRRTVSQGDGLRGRLTALHGVVLRGHGAIMRAASMLTYLGDVHRKNMNLVVANAV